MLTDEADLFIIFAQHCNLVKVKEVALLFRMSEDGNKFEDLKKIFNKGPTLVLIKCANGRVCGGFTSVGWRKLKDG